MDTDPVLTVIAFHSCFIVTWEKTAVRDGFVSYDLGMREFYRLEEKSLQALSG